MTATADQPVEWTATVAPQGDIVVRATAVANPEPFLLYRSDGTAAFDPATAVLVGTSDADGVVTDVARPPGSPAGEVAYGIVPVDALNTMGPNLPVPYFAQGTAVLSADQFASPDAAADGDHVVAFAPPSDNAEVGASFQTTHVNSLAIGFNGPGEPYVAPEGGRPGKVEVTVPKDSGPVIVTVGYDKVTPAPKDSPPDTQPTREHKTYEVLVPRMNTRIIDLRVMGIEITSVSVEKKDLASPDIIKGTVTVD